MPRLAPDGVAATTSDWIGAVESRPHDTGSGPAISREEPSGDSGIVPAGNPLAGVLSPPRPLCRRDRGASPGGGRAFVPTVPHPRIASDQKKAPTIGRGSGGGR